MVDVMREVHVDFVGVDVGVHSRVDPRDVMDLDEDRAVCRGRRGEGERILQVLAGRRMVEVYGSVLRKLLLSAAVE